MAEPAPPVPFDAVPFDALPFDAVVLAGGAGRRLGGADKAALTFAGMSLLDRVLAAVGDADRIVVVGPARPVGRHVLWAREQPPGGGPVAGLAAGLALVRAPVVAVLAVDLPFLRPVHVRALRHALAGGGAGGTQSRAAGATENGTESRPEGSTQSRAAGAVLVDDEGADQVLAGMWRSAALRRALPAEPAGVAMRRLVGELPHRRVALPGRPWRDVDTPADLAAARNQVTGAPGEAPGEGGL
jgi:molybdopterin-guanine dinucleotide biosynthesis protein A